MYQLSKSQTLRRRADIIYVNPFKNIVITVTSYFKSTIFDCLDFKKYFDVLHQRNIFIITKKTVKGLKV
ncbi:UNVERIFIED_CONTAM: hypothetical protein C3P01_17175 [Clostridioides difficile]